jgi:hypothetical protein
MPKPAYIEFTSLLSWDAPDAPLEPPSEVRLRVPAAALAGPRRSRTALPPWPSVVAAAPARGRR